jgi:hypothetical protein
MTTTVPAYTFGGITRPALILDDTGHIVLFGAAADFAATYGLKALYAGLPPGTPYPPVTDSLSTLVDSNGGANSVAEGAPANTAVGVTASASSATGTVTYSLVGDNSGGGFKINATTGVVTVNDPTKIDFESSPGHAYTITVQASDGVITSTSNFTIAVTDPPPSAPVDSNAATNTVAEGAAVNTLVGITASSTSATNDPPPTYSLTGDTSGGGFKINSTTGVVSVADPTKIDYEVPGHSYNITVQASDGATTSSQAFTIAVTDPPPSAPTDSDGTANSIAEGAAVNTLVGITAHSTTAATDPAATYSLTADSSGGGFKIDPNTGVVSVADPTKLDYETAPGHAYSITVQASDGALTSSQAFTIAVTDPPLPAPVDSNATANSVAEGAAANTLVGLTAFASTAATDPAATYSLTADTSGGGFQINSTTGVVSVADPTKLDYETAVGHAYTVTVQATDGVTTSSSNFTIAITDPPPSAPTDTDATANSVVEGAAANTLVGLTAFASTAANDPAATYSLTGDTSGGGFQINSTTGVVSVADPTKIDYEVPGHAYTITVQANDGTQTNSQVFTIGVTDVAPTAPTDADGTTNSIAEGAAVNTLVGITAHSTTSVTDPAATYSLTADSSGGGFKIDPNTGVVSVADPTKLDYETAPGHAYSITVQASDGTLTNSNSFTIAVTDPPVPAPVDSNATANSVAEGAAANTLVGLTAFASTPVTDPAATYSLTSDTSGGGFQINSTTGVVSVADPTKLDYETAVGHAYTVTVQASDGVTTGSSNFTIAITDPPPSAPVDTNAGTNTVAEAATAGTLVGITASSTSATNDPAATYSLTGDTSGGGFQINSTTGVVSVADPTKVDYESSGAGHSYTITVQASDGVATNSSNFSIAVTDVAAVANADSAVVFENRATTPSVNLLTNDTDVDAPPPPLTAVDDTQPSHGTVVVNSDGTFTYTANAGYLGADSFTYHASNGGALPSNSATVTLDVQPLVWHIDNAHTGDLIQDGSAAHPFQSIAAFNTANAAAGTHPDAVYLHFGTGTYTEANGIHLNNAQSLVGQGSALTYQTSASSPGGVQTITLIAADPAHTPTIVATAGDGVDVAQNNTLSGFHLGNASGNAISDEGGTVGTLTVSNVDINTSGEAVHIVNGGTLNVDLSSVTSTGGANGIALTNTSGTFHVHAGSLTGASGTEVALSSGSVNFTDDGTVGDTSGSNVSISSMTGGTQSFTGAISGHGISLTSNTGATINFSGGINLSTGSTSAFSASGGGTINVTGTNHLTTTTGTALNVANTTIGTSGLTFHDISSNGAADGIVLNNTGSGSLTVTGDGGASSNHSGGQIVSSTGSGVSLTTTGSVTLGYLDITNSGADGVNASGVNGFTLNRSNVSDNGGGATDEGLGLTNMSGTVAVSNSTITNAPHNGIFLHNTNTNLTAFNVTNTTITDSVAQSLGNDGILIETSGTTVLTSANVSGSTFSNMRATGLGVSAEDTSRIGFANNGLINGTSTTADDAANSLTVQNNTFSNNNIGVDFSQSQTANEVFQLLTNTITGDHSHGINVFSAAGADTGPTSHYMVGKIDGNTIGTQGVKDSGSAIGFGLRVASQGNATHTFLTVNNNTFHEIANQDVMEFVAQDGAATTTTGQANFKITNNTITAASGTNQFGGTEQGGLGIFVLADETMPVHTIITGNNISTTLPAGEFDVYLAERTGPPAGATLSVEGTGSVSSFIIANNTLNDANKFFDEEGNATLAAPGSGTFPLLAAPGGVQATTPTPGETHLTQAELNSVVAAAIAEWAAAGASASQLAAMKATSFSVADLTPGTIGQETAPAHITIDASAAGHGWYIDPTPSDNSEFTHAQNAAGTDLFTDPSSPAAGHLDLLTTVAHELGHVTGLPDLTAPSDTSDLMYIDLVDGERRLPTASDVAQAAPNTLFAVSGGIAADTPTPGETNLTQAELNKAVAAAIADWAAAGLSPDKIAQLEHVTFDVADVVPGVLGTSTAGHVTMDVSADGQGWFVDPTPSDNSEFGIAATSTALLTDSSTAAAGHIDLMTAVMHQMGDQLGLSDQFDIPSSAGTLMSAFLGTGERVLPSSDDAAQANANGSLAVPGWTDHLSQGDSSGGGDNFNFTPPSTITISVPAVGGAPALAPAPSPGLTAPAGDSFHWASAGETLTLTYATPTSGPNISIIDPSTDVFQWPTGSTSAPDMHNSVMHNSVVDTTVHDAVAPILPDPHTLAATVPSLGGYIIH